MEIAIAMELPRGEVENIRVGGLLHDIGKIEVSSEILLKASSLSLEEKKLMDEHTVKGGALLSSVGAVLQEVVPIVVSHHKYFTSVLEETQEESPDIPLGARVIAIADAFDAMVTDRPYRKGMLPREATEEIIRKTGKQFDPQAVDAFKYVMKEKMMQA
jgi:putative nucleotidyltransferase with HDIG domain